MRSPKVELASKTAGKMPATPRTKVTCLNAHWWYYMLVTNVLGAVAGSQ